MNPQDPQVIPPNAQQMSGSDDSAHEPPHIRDVKLNGDEAGKQLQQTPPGYIDMKPQLNDDVSGNGHIDHPENRPDNTDEARMSDDIDSDAPVLDIGGGRHGKPRVLDGDGHDREPDIIKDEKGEDEFVDEWDAELKGESKPVPDHDTRLHEELGEEAVEASGVQKVDDSEPVTSDGLDIHHEDDDAHAGGFPIIDEDVPYETNSSHSRVPDELNYGDIVYEQVHEYASKNGIRLSDGDARDIVDAVLDTRGITWKQAEDLSVDQDVELDPALFAPYK